jgi:hypothetical protein
MFCMCINLNAYVIRIGDGFVGRYRVDVSC